MMRQTVLRMEKVYENRTFYRYLLSGGKWGGKFGFPVKKGIVRNLSCICCDHADEVIVPTNKVRELLLSYGVKRKIWVQPTGISLSKFNIVDWKAVMAIKEKYKIDEEHHVLVSIGRLSKEKNLQEIIDFMHRIINIDNQARLLIVGDGPERKALEEQVRKENLMSCVYFTGEVNWKEIQNYYAVGDVFVAASTSETQGLTYVEALASGKPILVRKDECLDNILQNGLNGYCYQTEEEFIEGYEQLFDNEKCRRIAFEVRKSIRKMSSEAFGSNIEKIYVNLTNLIKVKGNEVNGPMHSIAE